MKKYPFYIWLSVIGVFVSVAIDFYHFIVRFFQKRFSLGHWLRYVGHVLFLWGVLIIAINFGVSLVCSLLAQSIPALHTILSILQMVILYLTGVFAAVRHHDWMAKNASMFE